MKVIVNSLATEYKDEGRGPVVLFLHGWKDNLHTFDALTPSFTEDWRVVRLDLPGFGGSQMPDGDWHLADYVNFVKAFTKKVGIQPSVLVGHSFGGRVILRGLAERDLEAKKAVLIASAGISKANTPRNVLFKIIAKVGRAVTLIPPLSFWRRQLRGKLYSYTGGDYFEAGRLGKTLLNIAREDLSSKAANIQTPTLLIWGDKDSETPLPDGKALAKAIPHSELKVVPGADHFIHKKHSAEVADLVKEFIENA